MAALNKKLHLLPQRIGNRNGWQIALSLSMLSLLLLFCGLAHVQCCTQHSIYCFIHLLECSPEVQFHSPDFKDERNETIRICMPNLGY